VGTEDEFYPFYELAQRCRRSDMPDVVLEVSRSLPEKSRPFKEAPISMARPPALALVRRWVQQPVAMGL
jgi:hypothetical protein